MPACMKKNRGSEARFGWKKLVGRLGQEDIRKDFGFLLPSNLLSSSSGAWPSGTRAAADALHASGERNEFRSTLVAAERGAGP
jgi:hypothetical protein